MINWLSVACASLLALIGYMVYDTIRAIKRMRALREKLKRLGVRV